MITLTPAIVAKAALEAHAQGRLCAQNFSGERYEPVNFYRHAQKPGVMCAVGAALPDDEAWKAHYPASDSANLHFPTPEDAKKVDAIQRAHDHWATSIEYPQDGDPEELEQEFLNLCRSHLND